MKDEQAAALGASLEAALARLETALAEAAALRSEAAASGKRERRLSMDSTDSGTPSSKERIGAKEAGNHPGYSLGCWLREYKEQAFLFKPLPRPPASAITPEHRQMPPCAR